MIGTGKIGISRFKHAQIGCHVQNFDDGGIINILGWNTDLFLLGANCQKELFQKCSNH
jgi:hypothetical protein